MEVAQSRLDAPCTLERLATRFGKTKPTIVVALNIAKERGLDATMINGRHLRPNWAKYHAREVADFFRRPGASMADAVRHFGKSDAWIRNARKMGLEIDSSETLPLADNVEISDTSTSSTSDKPACRDEDAA